MKHLDWLRERGEAVPAALVERVVAVMVAHPSWSELPTADALLAAGEKLVGAALGSGDETTRELARDLLAADALVTWAFEAAADDPGTLIARAELAMLRIEQVEM